MQVWGRAFKFPKFAGQLVATSKVYTTANLETGTPDSRPSCFAQYFYLLPSSNFYRCFPSAFLLPLPDQLRHSLFIRKARMARKSTVEIDLRQDAKRITKIIQQRVKDYPVHVNSGPGKDEDDLHMIMLGFGFDQSGWVALVFDTRPKAASDGEWQGYIEQNAEPFDHWFSAFDAMCEGKATLAITGIDGKTQKFTPEAELEDIAACFGLMCRDVLQQASQKGAFKKLPLAKNCRLAVEEHEGNYGWDDSQSEKSTDSQVAEACAEAEKLPKSKQLDFWIGKLEDLAQDKQHGTYYLLLLDPYLDAALAFGKVAIIPLLKWVNTIADKEEFLSQEMWKPVVAVQWPRQSVGFKILFRMHELKSLPPEAEPLIQQFIRNAIKKKPIHRGPNNKRPLYGTLPFHAARLLQKHFPNYPEPVRDDHSNQLLNADLFTRVQTRE